MKQQGIADMIDREGNKLSPDANEITMSRVHSALDSMFPGVQAMLPERELEAPYYGDAKEVADSGEAMEMSRIIMEKDATLADVLASLQNHDKYQDAMLSFWCGDEECLLTEIMSNCLKEQARKNLEQLAAEGAI